MGDELVSKLTNVLTSSTPQDLYAYVADETTRYIKLNPSNIEWLDKFNDHWCDGIKRDVVKRPTMCDSYGLTFYGIQKYIKLEGHLDWVSNDDRGGAVVELARAIQAGLGSVLELPNQGKDWLKECAKKAGEKDKHMIWTTPSGFIVEHVYQPIRQRRSYVELYNQKKLTLSFSNFIDGVNEKGQELGVAPNFIHSLDAAHMFITIFLMLQAGFTDFSMIHDSYGCHAPLIDKMDTLLREGFIETHKGNVLEQFKSDIEDYCEVTVPTPPVRRGTVTARCVKESEYFFA